MSDIGAPQDANEANAPRIQVVSQYVKDLSFENPGAPNPVGAGRQQIDLGVDIQARRLDTQMYEVELKLRVGSKQADDKPLFLLELAYAGLFQMTNIPEEVLQQVLLIEGPHLLFPFARRIVADAVRDGGMPPLMLEPVDFVAIYRARIEQMQQSRGPMATV